MSNQIVNDVIPQTFYDSYKSKYTEDLDVATFDFTTQRQKLDDLDWKGLSLDEDTIVAELEAYQRLLRLDPNQAVADALKDAGYQSAHQIAAIPEDQFIQSVQGNGQIDIEKARTIYRKAMDIKQRTALVYANVKDAVASPHYAATRFSNVHQNLIDFHEGLPNYQELFGSLNYCECEHCRSILSPAAYFVDLMRLVEGYITKPTDDALKLKARRPDLWQIPLDCEHTNTLVPYLQIVNEVMEKNLSVDLNKDALEHLATSHYPFNLPFNAPLEQIRIYLQHFKTDLATIYKTFKVEDAQVARETLGLSIEEYNLITNPDVTAATLNNAYGLDKAYGPTPIASDTDCGGLDRVDIFLAQTDLTPQQLQELIYNNLRHKGESVLSFDGVKDYVEVPHSDSIDFVEANQDFTVEVWAKSDAFTGGSDTLKRSLV